LVKQREFSVGADGERADAAGLFSLEVVDFPDGVEIPLAGMNREKRGAGDFACEALGRELAGGGVKREERLVAGCETALEGVPVTRAERRVGKPRARILRLKRRL
jgi:hypothetical protein